jgi:hypothetical protein
LFFVLWNLSRPALTVQAQSAKHKARPARSQLNLKLTFEI